MLLNYKNLLKSERTQRWRSHMIVFQDSLSVIEWCVITESMLDPLSYSKVGLVPLVTVCNKYVTAGQ